ncbi:MAG: ketol-acid reductoisomerase [Candidatus Eisenbacteria bacterium]
MKSDEASRGESRDEMKRNEAHSRDASRPAVDAGADLLAPLRGRKIGVIGYGNQGRAQAGNLRDAGFDVWVGCRAGGGSAALAAADRFRVVDPAEIGRHCSVAVLLTPDGTHGPILASLIDGPALAAVVFAHGFSLRFGGVPLSSRWDVLLVAPYGPGTSLRRDGKPGSIPGLIAVHQDASGDGWNLAKAYAVAAGCSATALVRSTVAHETEIDLFGEQAVLCGGIAALVTAAWETLVAAGYDPLLAYMECVQQVGLTSDMITRFGVAGMREKISPLALFGDLTRGPRVIDSATRERLAAILDDIRSGRFAEEWGREQQSGFPVSRAGLLASRQHPMEAIGREARGWGREPDRSSGEDDPAGT